MFESFLQSAGVLGDSDKLIFKSFLDPWIILTATLVIIVLIILFYQKTTVQDTFALAITAASTGDFQKLLTGNPNWLYSGADIDLYIDDDGEEKARSVRTYTFKEVSGAIEAPAVAADSWNLVWNSKISKWQLIDPATFAEVVAFPDAMPF